MTAHLADRGSVNAWDRDGLTFDRPAWWADAACRGGVRDEATGQPVDFFVGRGESKAPAVRVCNGCGVRESCLAWALQHGEHFGVWGGLSERERRQMRIRAAKSGPVVGSNGHRDRVAILTKAGWSASEIAAELGLTRRSVVRQRSAIHSDRGVRQ